MSNRTVPEGCAKYDLAPQNPIDIPAGVWHQGVNNTSKPAHIVEVWKGPNLTESDIERWGGVVGWQCSEKMLYYIKKGLSRIVSMLIIFTIVVDDADILRSRARGRPEEIKITKKGWHIAVPCYYKL